MREHAPGVDAHGDVEQLHDLRVAVRRVRALLRLAPPIGDDRAKSLRDEFGALGRALGPARDADVFAAYLRTATADLEEDGFERLFERVESERLEAYGVARAALDDAGFPLLLQSLDAFTQSVENGDHSLHDVVDGQATKLRKSMRDVSTDAALHRARIQAKRLRYTAEAAGDEQTIERVKRFQDFAGEHQDAVVAESRLRELVEPETAVLVGRLIERQALRRQRARRRTLKAWKRLAKTTK